MKPSHKRVIEAMQNGYGLTTVDTGKPSLHKDGRVLGTVKRKTLDEMVALGLLHRTYDYVGDGTFVDDFWHLGPGGEETMQFCRNCETRECVQCHPCFHLMYFDGLALTEYCDELRNKYNLLVVTRGNAVLLIDPSSFQLTQQEINLLVQVRKFYAADHDAKPIKQWNTIHFRKNAKGWSYRRETWFDDWTGGEQKPYMDLPTLVERIMLSDWPNFVRFMTKI